MNTPQLECFLAVVNYLNFSRAAEELRITQPAVSHQISALEDELGAKLFHRTSKSVRLTQEGYLFLQYAEEIIRLTNQSKSRLKKMQSVQPMFLGIGCRSSVELRLISPALARLRQEHPQLLPQLRLIPFASLENLLTDGDIQVMFTFQESAPKRAVYRELLHCPIVCVCGEEHPLAKERQVTLLQLESAGSIAANRPSACPPSLANLQGRIITSLPPEQVIFSDHPDVTHTLLEAGFAFAVMADFPQAREPGLRYIPMPELPALSFGAACLPGEISPVLRRLLRLLEEGLAAGEAGVFSLPDP